MASRSRVFFGAVLLIAVTVIRPAGAQTAYFVVGEWDPVANDSYVLPLSNPQDIQHARDLITFGPTIGSALVVATYTLSADGINRDYLAPGQPLWSWHVTRFLGFADFTAEILDGSPTGLELHPEYSYGIIGFWSYTVIGELFVPPLPYDGDFDDNGIVDSHDIDILWNVIRPEVAGSQDPGNDDDEDLNRDALVNEDDVDYLLANLLTAGDNRSYGDADLDGGVGGLDYTAWRQRAGTGWANGDFDGDGGVGGLDYTLWRTRPTAYPTNVGPHSGSGLAAVPEPSGLILMGLAGLALAGLRSRRIGR